MGRRRNAILRLEKTCDCENLGSCRLTNSNFEIAFERFLIDCSPEESGSF